MTQARILAPALRSYSGGVTRPERWSTWSPRMGDILVCTPPKCGTTWTQTMLTMLVYGGPEALPGKVPVLSPWVDADLGVPADEVAAALAAQEGRRVVKTHAPADGFPVWEGVSVVAVYRHPLDAFFSLRKHAENMADRDHNEPMLQPLSEAFRYYVTAPAQPDHMDVDCLEMLVLHYQQTALSGRLPELRLFHYADMLRDGRRTVAALAQATGIAADAGLIARVAEATAFCAMKANAAQFAPVAGTGFWKSDAGFFDSASSGKWQGALSEEDLALYRQRLEELVPDSAARHWLENGQGSVEPPAPASAPASRGRRADLSAKTRLATNSQGSAPFHPAARACKRSPRQGRTARRGPIGK